MGIGIGPRPATICPLLATATTTTPWPASLGVPLACSSWWTQRWQPCCPRSPRIKCSAPLERRRQRSQQLCQWGPVRREGSIWPRALGWERGVALKRRSPRLAAQGRKSCGNEVLWSTMPCVTARRHRHSKVEQTTPPQCNLAGISALPRRVLAGQGPRSSPSSQKCTQCRCRCR